MNFVQPVVVWKSILYSYIHIKHSQDTVFMLITLNIQYCTCPLPCYTFHPVVYCFKNFRRNRFFNLSIFRRQSGIGVLKQMIHSVHYADTALRSSFFKGFFPYRFIQRCKNRRNRQPYSAHPVQVQKVRQWFRYRFSEIPGKFQAFAC